MTPKERRQYNRDQYKKRKEKISLIQVAQNEDMSGNQEILLNEGGKSNKQKSVVFIDNQIVLTLRKKWAESKRNLRNNKRKENRDKFNKDRATEKNKERMKKREENEVAFKETLALQQRNLRKRNRNENEEIFKDSQANVKRKTRAKCRQKN